MYEMITLANGVRILTQPVPAVRTAALGIYIGTGSRHEQAAENGAAHFLEHMAFKATEHRSADRLAQDIDTLGGQVNAYTTKEMTCFHARCLDSHLERVIDLLCDMLFHSRFLPEEVDTERGVILEEIGMYKDDPADLVYERLAAAIYKGSPLARPILGTKRTLSAMDGEWLRKYKRTHYRPDRIVVSLAGSFTPAAVDELKARFCALSESPASAVKAVKYLPSITLKRKAVEQNHMILAFPARSATHSRRYEQLLLSSVLGGGVSSRLFQEMREKRGLCYSVYSYVNDYEDVGLLGLYTALGKETEAQALDTLCRVTAQLAEHGPEPDELERAREQAKANVLMGLESTQARMSHMGISMLVRGHVPNADDITAAYDAITVEQLRALAQELFDFSKASLSVVGKVDSQARYRDALERFV